MADVDFRVAILGINKGFDAIDADRLLLQRMDRLSQELATEQPLAQRTVTCLLWAEL
jgi:hypothetical protein